MDAYAYLIRHGWSGPGNPLNPDGAGVRGGLGLTKPLLVARRSGNSGVGNKTTKDPTNQWWLRGFEDALKGIGQAGTTGTGQGQSGVGKGNALTSELYRFFVRGETVPGTLGNKDNEKEKDGRKKRKRDDGDGDETKEERRLRKEEKKRRKVEKEERRERRREKREKKARKAEKKEKEKKPEDDYPTPVSMDLDSTYNQDGGSELDKLKEKKEKRDRKSKEKEEKSSKEKKKDKKRESSDESSKRKSKKSEST